MNDRTQMIKAIRGDLQSRLPAINEALPATVKRYLTPERMTKIALMTIIRQPALLNCSRASILEAVIGLAQIGLEPGGPLGHAYLVPFKQTCQPIIGYRGLIALARRSGELSSITAQVVFERDEFEIDLGSGEPPVHHPYLKGERGKPYCVYCVAKFRDGSRHTEVMTMDEVNKIRNRSRAKDNGPWVTDYLEMAKKTVVRRASKYWPISIEFADALELEDRQETGVQEIVESEIMLEGGATAPSSTSRTAEVLDMMGRPVERTPEPPPPSVDEPQQTSIPTGPGYAYEELLERAAIRGVPDDELKEWCLELQITNRTRSQKKFAELADLIDGWEAE